MPPGFARGSERCVEQIDASWGILFGVILVGIGSGGVGIFVLGILPPVLSFCSCVAIIGLVLVVVENRVADRLFFGRSFSDILVGFNGWWNAPAILVKKYSMLFLHPKLEVKDATVLLQMIPAVAEHRSICPSPKVSTSCDDAFNLAVQWLKRPGLSLGFAEQIRLHSLVLQASGPLVRDPVARGTTPQNALARSKQEGLLALRSVSRAEARRWLPVALAEFDAGFAAAHPELGPWTLDGHITTAMAQLFARRLPRDLDDCIALAQRRLFRAAAAATAVFSLAAIRARTRAHGSRFLWSLAAACGGMATAYLAAVAHGLPAWLFAEVFQRSRRRGTTLFLAWEPGQANPLLCFLRLFCRCLAPRVRRSIFVA